MFKVNKSREQFNTWWDEPAQSELSISCAKGWAFVVWQASRATLVVELPDEKEVKEAIRTVGITVK